MFKWQSDWEIKVWSANISQIVKSFVMIFLEKFLLVSGTSFHSFMLSFGWTGSEITTGIPMFRDRIRDLNPEMANSDPRSGSDFRISGFQSGPGSRVKIWRKSFFAYEISFWIFFWNFLCFRLVLIKLPQFSLVFEIFRLCWIFQLNFWIFSQIPNRVFRFIPIHELEMGFRDWGHLSGLAKIMIPKIGPDTDPALPYFAYFPISYN